VQEIEVAAALQLSPTALQVPANSERATLVKHTYVCVIPATIPSE